VALTKTRKKTRDNKERIVALVRDCCDECAPLPCTAHPLPSPHAPRASRCRLRFARVPRPREHDAALHARAANLRRRALPGRALTRRLRVSQVWQRVCVSLREHAQRHAEGAARQAARRGAVRTRPAQEPGARCGCNARPGLSRRPRCAARAVPGARPPRHRYAHAACMSRWVFIPVPKRVRRLSC